MSSNNNMNKPEIKSRYNKSVESKQAEARRKKQEERKANNCNYLFNPYTRYGRIDPNYESKIKTSTAPVNVLDPNNIQDIITEKISKEEQIKIKKNNNEKLNSKEKIILENYLKKEKEKLETDLENLEKLELSAKPETKEGKTRLLLKVLNYQLKNKNYEYVANVHLRLMEKDNFEITPEIRRDFNYELSEMNKIVKSQDLIKLQFNEFHNQMPPLNVKGFKKFDDWQLKVINNIDNNKSTIVNAPTSAGKSVLSSYVTTKGRTLFVVPTDILAWQMASYIEKCIKSFVPIITESYKSYFGKDIETTSEILNKANALVGTVEYIIDILPLLNTNFTWVVFDEIHMIGKEQGAGMERIFKVLSNVSFLALSATIGNTDFLGDWFSSITGKSVEKIICDKRFFNLQKYYYDNSSNSLVTINPIAMIEEEHLIDKSILNKTLQPTPPNIWDFAIKLGQKFKLGKLDPRVYFDVNKRIELDETYKYFNKLIEFMLKMYESNPKLVMEIINNYKYTKLDNNEVDLIKLTFKLKHENKNPTIIFQNNTYACLRLAREYAKEIDRLETEKFPRLIKNRLKNAKIAEKINKKNKKILETKDTNSKSEYSKKEIKKVIGNVKLKKDKYGESSVKKITDITVEVVSTQEPHSDFTLNSNQYFTEFMVEEWQETLKRFFPKTGDEYHYIIKLLWRGVGIYASGLPDPYLRLVQSLACEKKLAIVFSDFSLVFGVNMPFRSVVIFRNTNFEDDIDSMIYHQMSGRAGRRGLDTEGNIIFAGYGWQRIKELSICETPNIEGYNSIIYTVPHAKKISEKMSTKQNWTEVYKNNIDSSVNKDYLEFYNGIETNYEGGWNFGINEDINHLMMNWKLRHSDDGLIISYLLPYLRKAFENKDYTKEYNQIELAHFLCRFLLTKSTTDESKVLKDPEILSTEPYNKILQHFEDIQIDIPAMIDNSIFQSIQINNLDHNLNDVRQRLLEFSKKLTIIQHFCFQTKIVGLCKLMAKLLTRIWWIYHSSSPIMLPFRTFEQTNNDESKESNNNNLDENNENNNNENEEDTEYEKDTEEEDEDDSDDYADDEEEM